MSSLSKYTIVILVALAIIFVITIFTTQSVRDIGGLSPLEEEYKQPIQVKPPDTKEDEILEPEMEAEESRPPQEEEITGEQPSQRVTVRDFLVDDQKEGEGYGLYSYLLFTAPPTEATEEKYRALLSAFLRKVSTAASVEAYLERKYLNVTYIPVKNNPPRTLHRMGLLLQVEWILQNYNYDRARVLLAIFTQETSGGPYIYSRQNPVYLRDLQDTHTILQDMAQAPASLCGLWLDKFIKQAAREEFWQEDRLFAFTVSLRTAVANLGSGVETVSQSMDWWQEKMEQWIRIEKVAGL